MENKIIACVLDVVGVQSYIFSSNKLKENLGASFIVKNIYKDHLANVIKEHFELAKFDIDFWKSNLEISQSENEPGAGLFRHYDVIDICYIGGGNALLFFKSIEDYSDILKKFSTRLLVDAPGVHLSSAHIETTISDIENNFGEKRDTLIKQLEINKNTCLPNIFLPRHGFTASCPRTGLSAEALVNHDTVTPLSSVSVTKIYHADSKAFKDEFKDLLDTTHIRLNPSKDKSKALGFTDNIEHLGQGDGDDNFIAVVHIDGNEIGKVFREAFKNRNFIQVRRLSVGLAQKTWDSFEALVEVILKDEKECLISDQNKKHYSLPIRPIIIGGDDITFVSPGKLGIYFAKTFLEIFEKQTSQLTSGPLSACAGIAIAKTKYPFFRAYKIAEALCDTAKKMRKKTGDQGSWIDYHIIEAAKTGDLDQVRKHHFQTPLGKLYMKPYPLVRSPHLHLNKLSFSCLMEEAIALKKLPKNKRMDIARVLFENKNEQEKLIEHLKYRDIYKDKALPLPDPAKKSFFQTVADPTAKDQPNETYFLDLLELLEFYPDELIGESPHPSKAAGKEVSHENEA